MNVEESIKMNLQTSDSPVHGSTFIAPDGKFVDLHSKGYDHLKFMKQLVLQGILNKRVLENEEIPELFRKGYIRCNEDAGMGYSYIELRDKEPTYDQYDAIEKWIDFVLSTKKHVTVIFMPDYAWDEQEYGQTVSGYDVVKAIKKAYKTGELISSAAFESVSMKTRTACEMSTVQPSKSGLDMRVWLDDFGEKRDIPHNTFRLKYGPHFDDFVEVPFFKKKEIYSYIGQKKWKPDMKKLSKWINLNYDILIKFYSQDEEYDIADFMFEMKSVK